MHLTPLQLWRRRSLCEIKKCEDKKKDLPFVSVWRTETDLCSWFLQVRCVWVCVDVKKPPQKPAVSLGYTSPWRKLDPSYPSLLPAKPGRPELEVPRGKWWDDPNTNVMGKIISCLYGSGCGFLLWVPAVGSLLSTQEKKVGVTVRSGLYSGKRSCVKGVKCAKTSPTPH